MTAGANCMSRCRTPILQPTSEPATHGIRRLRHRANRGCSLSRCCARRLEYPQPRSCASRRRSEPSDRETSCFDSIRGRPYHQRSHNLTIRAHIGSHPMHPLQNLRQGLHLTFLVGFALLGLGSTLSAEPLKLRIAWSVAPAQLAPILLDPPGVTKHNGTSYVLEAIRFPGSAQTLQALGA